jgi:multiple sugar transport system substrate-binding protein
LLGSSLAVAAAGSLARPFIANAAATTATVWWVQGFAHEEDIAFNKLVADNETASGNTISRRSSPTRRCGTYAETALALVNCYNNVAKKRGIYGVPYTIDVFTNHIWQPLVEKAGYKIHDIPKTWDALYDFFKDVQKKLPEQRVRNVDGLGFQLTTNGGDPNAFFVQWVIAYGGHNIVGKDGRLHLDDPRVREAAIKALTYPTTAYKEGFVPPGAINWNDADDNNAFHAKTIVMDLDGSISTEVAIIANKQELRRHRDLGLADDNDGKSVPSGSFSVVG